MADAGLAGIFERGGQGAVDVGVAGDLDAVGQVADAAWPVGGDVVREPGDVLDGDDVAAVGDADRLHADRATRPGLDRAHRDFERPLGDRAIERLAEFVDGNTECLRHQPDLALPFAGDGAGESDPRLVVEWPTEAQGVAHDVGHPVVVVQTDFVGVDLSTDDDWVDSTRGR